MLWNTNYCNNNYCNKNVNQQWATAVNTPVQVQFSETVDVASVTRVKFTQKLCDSPLLCSPFSGAESVIKNGILKLLTQVMEQRVTNLSWRNRKLEADPSRGAVSQLYSVQTVVAASWPQELVVWSIIESSETGLILASKQASSILVSPRMQKA